MANTVRREKRKRVRVKVCRSAKTGQFVSAKYAKSHPTTTVAETVVRESPAEQEG